MKFSLFFWMICALAFVNHPTTAKSYNQSPVAIFNVSPPFGTAPLAVSFNGTASYDPDGSFINHVWSFGDGTSDTGATTTHTYLEPGEYTVSLLVFDISGASNLTTKIVTVVPASGTYTLNLDPIQDAFLQSGTRINNTNIEISATKVAYLMFDIPAGIGNIIDANLELYHINSSNPQGRIEVWKGSHNSWSELGLSESNKPFPVNVVGERSGIFGSNSYYEWDISEVVGGQTYSYILSSEDANFIFTSSEFPVNNILPKLVLTVDNSSPPVIPPTVAITVPNTNTTVPAGSSITFQANASDNGSVTKVDFFRGNILLGTDNTAPYEYVLVGAVAEEVYNVKAIATDNEGFTTSSQMVHIDVGINSLPVGLITTPTNGSTYNTDDNVLVVVSASDSDGYIEKVEFYDGNVKLGEDTTLPYEYSISNLGLGTHDITARIYDNVGVYAVSNLVTVYVEEACGVNAVAELEFDTATSGNNTQNSGGADGILKGNSTKVTASTGGNVILLSSAGDYVEVPHYNDIGFIDAITLSSWVNMNQIVGDAGIIVKGKTARAYGLRVTSFGTLNFNVPGGGSWSSSSVLNLHQWYHVAVTYDGSNVRFYVDGVQDPHIPTAIINFPTNVEPLTIGADLVNTDKYFDGLIDDVKVHCRALSNSDIITLASASTPHILPTLNVLAPINGASYFTNDDVLIQANANDLDGTINKVEFYVNGVKVGEDLTAPYEYIYSTSFEGSYNIIIRTIDNQGNIATENRSITINEKALILNLKVLLHSAYNTNTGLMNDDLRLAGVIPNNFEGSTISNTNIFDITGSNAIVDWIKIELRPADTPDVISVSRSALLQRDGDIVDTDGESLIVFETLPQGNYYVAIRHRNHLGVMYNILVTID